jgi:hypothetical protein
MCTTVDMFGWQLAVRSQQSAVGSQQSAVRGRQSLTIKQTIGRRPLTVNQNGCITIFLLDHNIVITFVLSMFFDCYMTPGVSGVPAQTCSAQGRRLRGKNCSHVLQ